MKFYRLPQLAKATGLSKGHIQYYIKIGYIKPTYTFRKLRQNAYYFDENDFQKAVEKIKQLREEYDWGKKILRS